MKILLVGFDSAWIQGNQGAIVGAVINPDGSILELSFPVAADFPQATAIIQKWQKELAPCKTLILLDQPIVVLNPSGQRPVEHLVASPVGRRYGGVQPANTARAQMFGDDAPLRPFLAFFGGAADPLTPLVGTHVIETYPVLTMIALGWTLPDSRSTGRLPKYNPTRKSSFRPDDWVHVCLTARDAMRSEGLQELSSWLDHAAQSRYPSKSSQDRVDSCICLLTAVHLAKGEDAFLVGNAGTGYMVSPYGENLHREIVERCISTGRDSRDWAQKFRLSLC